MAPSIDARAFYVKTNAPIQRIGRCLHMGPIEASAIAPLMLNRQPTFTAEERNAPKRHIVFADLADLERPLLRCSSPKMQSIITDSTKDEVDNNLILFDMDTPLLSHESYQSRMHPQIDQPFGRVPKPYKTWATRQMETATHVLQQGWMFVIFCCRQGKMLIVNCMSGSKLRREKRNKVLEEDLDLKPMPRSVEYRRF